MTVGDHRDVQGEDHRRRFVDRPRAAEDRRHRPAGDSVGRFVEAEGRRMGDGGRQSVLAEPDGDARHRQRARPRQRRHHAVRGLHPDRCGDQSRQLRRRADQQPRRARRHQHRDLFAERRLPGHRLRGAQQPRAPRRRRPAEVRPGAPRIDRLCRSDAATARLADELRAPTSDGVVVNQMSRDSAAYKNGLRAGRHHPVASTARPSPTRRSSSG